MKFNLEGNAPMIRKILYSLVIFFLIFATMGCSISKILPIQQDETQEDTREETGLLPELTLPTMGGQLRIPISQPDSIDPLLTKSRDFINFSGLIYEGLFSYDKDLNIVPMLAESWEVTDGGKLWRFYLRKGVSWHHGGEFTAKDVKHTFDILLNQAQGLEKEEVGSIHAKRLFDGRNIARMEFVINNPYAVDLILNEPTGIGLLEAMTFPILPAGEEEHDFGLMDIESLNGTGPYKVEAGSIEAGGEVRLVRNDEWWGSPKPYIDSIVAKVYEDNVQSVEAFKGGQVDLVDTHVIYGKTHGMGGQVQSYPYLTQYFNYIGINHNYPGILRNVTTRQAIAYAIDRKDILPRVYSGNAQAVDVPIPPDAWYYNSDLRVYDYQPQKALQLLSQVGLMDTDDIDIPDVDVEDEEETQRPTFTINVHMDNILHKEAVNLIVKQLGEVGIDVKIRLLPWDEYITALEEGDFEAVFVEYYSDIATDLKPFFYSRELPQGFNNYAGYSNEELDGLLDRIDQINDPSEFKDIYKRIQEILVDELPIISLYYRTSSIITNERVHGIRAPRELMIFRDINEWYLSK